jgi:hypothetical protein
MAKPQSEYMRVRVDGRLVKMTIAEYREWLKKQQQVTDEQYREWLREQGGKR